MTLQLTIISAAALCVVGASIAQETIDRRSQPTDFSRQRVTRSRVGQLQTTLKGSELIGMLVKNYQDQNVGKVEELAVDVESGRILHLILSTGGFVGIGDTHTAVPPEAVHYDSAHRVLQLDADKERLQAAPKFELSKWADYGDYDHLHKVYQYYGDDSALGFIDRAEAGRPSSPNTISTRRPDGTWEDRLSSESQSMIPAARLSGLQRGSKLIGKSVRNLQDEKLGDVDNFLVDLPSGRVVAVIVSTGGFLGLGEELSAVPPSALQVVKNGEVLELDASKGMLSKAPHFKSKEWPNFSQPEYVGGVYRAYRIDPYFATTGASEPDNTVRNVRDRDDRSITPLDQSNVRSDVNLTAQIRRQIMLADNLSVNARNVKIISSQGHVVLRGPVNSSEEKRLIGEIAARAARAENVDNELEVKNAVSPN